MARRPAKTPVRPVIFDTDILIWYFRGHAEAARLLEHTEHAHRWIAALSLMELLQGCRSRHETGEILAFVATNIARVVHPDAQCSERAIHLIQQYALPHGLRVVDALIAAGALLNRARLATGNRRHFRYIEGLELLPFGVPPPADPPEQD